MLLLSWHPSNGFSPQSKSQKTYTGLQGPTPPRFPLPLWPYLLPAQRGRFTAKTGPNFPPLPIFTSFAMWLQGSAHEEVKFVPDPLKLSWSYELLWPTECGRSTVVSVLSPGLKRSCVHARSLFSSLSPPCFSLSFSPSPLSLSSCYGLSRSSFFLSSPFSPPSLLGMRTEYHLTGGWETHRYVEQS